MQSNQDLSTFLDDIAGDEIYITSKFSEETIPYVISGKSQTLPEIRLRELEKVARDMFVWCEEDVMYKTKESKVSGSI